MTDKEWNEAREKELASLRKQYTEGRISPTNFVRRAATIGYVVSPCGRGKVCDITKIDRSTNSLGKRSLKL